MQPIAEGPSPVEGQLFVWYVHFVWIIPVGVTIIMCIDLQLLYDAVRHFTFHFNFTHCKYFLILIR
jgi:hypothetical protein